MALGSFMIESQLINYDVSQLVLRKGHQFHALD